MLDIKTITKERPQKEHILMSIINMKICWNTFLNQAWLTFKIRANKCSERNIHFIWSAITVLSCKFIALMRLQQIFILLIITPSD